MDDVARYVREILDRIPPCHASHEGECALSPDYILRTVRARFAQEGPAQERAFLLRVSAAPEAWWATLRNMLPKRAC